MLTISNPAARQQQSRGFGPGAAPWDMAASQSTGQSTYMNSRGLRGLTITLLRDSPWTHSSPTGTSAAILSKALPRLLLLNTLSFPTRRPDQWNACPSGCTPVTGIWSARRVETSTKGGDSCLTRQTQMNKGRGLRAKSSVKSSRQNHASLKTSGRTFQ